MIWQLNTAFFSYNYAFREHLFTNNKFKEPNPSSCPSVSIFVNNSYFHTFLDSFLPSKMSSLPVEDGEILEYLEELSEISSDDEEFEKLREQKKNLEFENFWMSGMYKIL